MKYLDKKVILWHHEAPSFLRVLAGHQKNPIVNKAELVIKNCNVNTALQYLDIFFLKLRFYFYTNK